MKAIFLTLAGAACLTLAATRAADAPAQLQPVQTSSELVAPNPAPTPEDYKRMQGTATEVVAIHVLDVATVPAKTMSNTPGALLVAVHASVTAVTRTATKLAVGSVITLSYGYVPAAPGRPAPPPTPVLKKDGDYLAYLVGGPGDLPYMPVAGAQSFIAADAGAAPASDDRAARLFSSGPLADIAVLPTPDNPVPPGSVRLRNAALQQFVKLSQQNGHWFVSVAEADPVPLETIGDAAPTLLVYYSPPLRTPPTQPGVLVYVAGTQPATPPAQGKVTVERALVLDGNHHKLGDALWAQLADENQRPILLPVWHWSEYKVDVEDLEKHTVQTILFTGGQAPAPPASQAGTAPAK